MLTSLAIHKLKPREKEYSKTVLPGLYIRVKVNGTKIWVFKKKIAGVCVSQSFGTFPSLSYKDALIKYEQTLQTHALPLEQAKDFEVIFKDWLNLKKQTLTQNSVIKISRAFERLLVPKFGKIPIDLITTPALISVLKSYEDRPESLKKLCGWLKQFEIFAVNSGKLNTLRWQGIDKVFASPRAKNMPSIPPSELPNFFTKLLKESATSTFVLDALMIGFYTLLRPGEYTQLRWDWVREDTIYVPAEVMKMKRPHRVPISRQLKKLLEHRPKVSEFILFSPRNLDKHILPDTIEKFLRTHGFRGVLVPHGVRSIGRTWMSEARVPFDVAELCLAHSVGSQTVQAYDRSDLLEERRKVMQEWCDFVETCFNQKKTTDFMSII